MSTPEPNISQEPHTGDKRKRDDEVEKEESKRRKLTEKETLQEEEGEKEEEANPLVQQEEEIRAREKIIEVEKELKEEEEKARAEKVKREKLAAIDKDKVYVMINAKEVFIFQPTIWKTIVELDLDWSEAVAFPSGATEPLQELINNMENVNYFDVCVHDFTMFNQEGVDNVVSFLMKAKKKEQSIDLIISCLSGVADDDDEYPFHMDNIDNQECESYECEICFLKCARKSYKSYK